MGRVEAETKTKELPETVTRETKEKRGTGNMEEQRPWLMGTAGEFMAKVIDIDSLQLDEEFKKVPGELAYFGEQYSQAYTAYLIAKKELDQVYAKVYHEILEENPKKPTVKFIETSIELHEDYQAARQAMIDADGVRQETRGKVDVVSAKKEMLISLGAHMRTEMSEMSIKRRSERVEY